MDALLGSGPFTRLRLDARGLAFPPPGKWKSLRARPAEYPGLTISDGRPVGAQAKTKRTRHTARALPLRHRLVSGRVSGSPRLDYHPSPSERSRTSYLGGIMPCPKIARPMPPACGLRGRTDSRADPAWLEVRATGPDYPIAKATQTNPQVSTEGVVQLDGICCLGAPIDRVGITRPPYAYPGFPPP